MPSREPGASSEQQTANEWLIAAASGRLGVALAPRRFALAGDAWFEVNGYAAQPATLAMVYARLGKMLTAQRDKVGADVLKLLYARDLMGGGAQLVLVFASEEAAQVLDARTWLGQCAAHYGVETLVIELPVEMREKILAAQQRQYR